MAIICTGKWRQYVIASTKAFHEKHGDNEPYSMKWHGRATLLRGTAVAL